VCGICVVCLGGVYVVRECFVCCVGVVLVCVSFCVPFVCAVCVCADFFCCVCVSVLWV